jgi:hypothetical protein
MTTDGKQISHATRGKLSGWPSTSEVMWVTVTLSPLTPSVGNLRLEVAYFGALVTAFGATWPFVRFAAAALVQVSAISRKAFFSSSVLAVPAQ